MPVIGGSVAGYRLPQYVGPGDLISGASTWSGLRAYSRATTGANAIRLRRDSDNLEQDFVTLSNGNLDIASITTFKGAANLLVTKIYDQTGNGFDCSQVTAALQPQFVIATLGVTASMQFLNANGERLDSTATFTLSQPFTLSSVGIRTTFVASNSSIFGIVAGAPRLGFRSSANQAFGYAGGGADIFGTATDGVWHALNFAVNGAASDINIDGTSNIGDPGSGGAANLVRYNDDITLTGNVVEGGIWPFQFTAGQSASMSANQHSYWGF